jgi:hypothetical protein
MLLILALAAEQNHQSNAGLLPVCTNRVINAVVKRAGCTLGDTRCWLSGGGYCTDYVERQVRSGPVGKAAKLVGVKPDQVRRGDLAAFMARAHYAYVEKVILDGAGKPVAVDVSEYNFGSCWVDADLMITDKYKLVNKRAGLPIGEVDGGFLRAVPATP